MAQGQLSYHINFLIGIIYIMNAVNKPSIAIGIWVGQRHRLSTLQRQDEILGIEHVKHRIDAITIHLCHITSCLTDRLEDMVYLR